MSHNSQLSPRQESKSKTASANVRLDKARHNVILDLDEKIPEVKKTFFCDNLLPPNPLPTGTAISDVISVLKAARDISVDGNWNGWAPPSATNGTEDDIFSKLAGLTHTICQASGIVGVQRTTTFKCNPSSTLMSKTRNNSSKPDCYAILTNSPLLVDPHAVGRYHWLDVAVPGEFKKNADEGEGGVNFRDVSTRSTLCRIFTMGQGLTLRT